MSKSKLMRSMSIVMAAAMMSGLTACGGGGSTQTTAAPAETKAEAASKENGEKKEEAAAAEELVAEDGAEIEVAYWEGSTSDKEAWDELIANLQWIIRRSRSVHRLIHHLILEICWIPESLAMTGQMLSVIPISVLVSSKKQMLCWIYPHTFPRKA